MRRSMIVTALAAVFAVMALGIGQAGATHVLPVVLVDGSDTTPDAGGCGDPLNPCNTIQAGIDHANTGETVQVASGTYSENLSLGKDLTLRGMQAGIDACGRMAVGGESTVTGSGVLLTLVTGSAGATIDGFSFLGGTRAIESTSGPINSLEILNNRMGGFTNAGVFLNDNGINITADQNEIDGTSKTGAGDLFHLDTDNFDGFQFTDNCVANGVTGTGFFVDGNHNVDASTAGSRTPEFTGNLIDNNNTGTNLGRFAWGTGPISNNTFSNNNFDGLQGGIQNSQISQNTFADNGRSGLALTGFGGSGDATRGAQNDDVLMNCFTGNGFTNGGEAIFFTAGQFPGTISTNQANQNNIQGNAMGARYSGTEIIDATMNWWGAVDGPGPPDGTGSGDGVDGAGILYTPFLMAPAAGAPQCAPPPPPEPCDVKVTQGGWIIADNGDRASFGGVAKSDELGNVMGQEEYQDHGPADPQNVKSIEVLMVTCNDDRTQATITGTATIDGSGMHMFTIDVQDLGEPGRGVDTYRIQLDTGYDSGEHTLRGGNVQIH